MSDLIAYQELIDKKALDNSTDVIPNAGEYHAAIVMSKLFDLTNTSVNMLVGNFSGKISNQDNYIKSLKRCLNDNVTFNIMFLDNPNEASEAYKLLRDKQSKGGNIIFKSAPAAFKERLSKNNGEKHFAVFDDNKYRFEKDTINHLAWVCFNDKNHATTLNNIFLPVFEEGAVI